MKRLVIDGDLCQGTRECQALAPSAVTFDAMGIAHTVDGGPTISDDVADRVAATCPSMAITAVPA
ncbi:MAG: ferredoxin [Acidimicrobiaceae bacterium]|jgi:ferredoxin